MKRTHKRRKKTFTISFNQPPQAELFGHLKFRGTLYTRKFHVVPF